MSSSPPAEPRARRAWSLRFQLLVGQVVVLAAVCVGITAATELALLHHLTAQLDSQLAGTSFRSALMYPEPKRPGWHESHFYPRPGPGPRFLDAPGQPAGMVAAVVNHGNAIDAGYLTSSGTRAALTPAAQVQLEKIADNRSPVTVNLDGLGRYRVVAAPSRAGGDTIVTGLSMANVDATMMRMLVIFGIVEISKKWYDSLPAELRQILDKDAAAASVAINPRAIEINERARAAWTASGGELISLPADEQSSLLKIVASVGDEVSNAKPQLAAAYKIVTDAVR